MIRIVFDSWDSDRSLLGKYFKGAGDLADYSVDSEHTVTSFTGKGGNRGFVLVGTPSRCPDFIERMHELKDSYVSRGYRASLEVVDFDDKVAGFAWNIPRGKR